MSSVEEKRAEIASVLAMGLLRYFHGTSEAVDLEVEPSVHTTVCKAGETDE